MALGSRSLQYHLHRKQCLQRPDGHGGGVRHWARPDVLLVVGRGPEHEGGRNEVGEGDIIGVGRRHLGVCSRSLSYTGCRSKLWSPQVRAVDGKSSTFCKRESSSSMRLRSKWDFTMEEWLWSPLEHDGRLDWRRWMVKIG
jgi:hypothetical protein